LGEQDQAALTLAIRDYFTKERLDPKAAPLMDEAWRYQGTGESHNLRSHITDHKY